MSKIVRCRKYANSYRYNIIREFQDIVNKLANLFCWIFAMINVILFTVVLLPCLPFLHSATDGNISSCPESFSCPGLAAFNYPFYSGTDNRCGLIKVNCIKNETIQLGGRSYEIFGRSDSRPTVLIHNRTFDKLLENNKCMALMDNFTSPSPLLFSISITPFVTVFKCTKNLSSAQQNDAYFDQSNYNSYNICKDHNFYYKYSVSNETVPNDLPLTCQVIQLPLKALWQSSLSDVTNIFSLISPYFSVTFNLTPSCNNCHKKGGHCSTTKGHFQCLDAIKEKPRRELILILVLVGFALVLLLCPVIFLIRRCYKNPFSYSSSKQKSTNLEDGSCFFGVVVFSYSELEDATKNFSPSHEIGDGGFGAVYYGKLKDGREVAVKRLYDHNYKRVQQYMNEVDILTRLRHPNLVVLYGCTSRQSRELLLVYEYIPNGTVADHLHGEKDNPSRLKWPLRMKIAIETATALAYLHASEIIHRDVKTSNILLDLNFCVKVADFGLSRLIPDNATHVSTAPQGTPGYLDPQYHQRYQLTEKSDVYSFGVVLIELISSMVAVDLSRSHDEIGLANLALNMIQRSAINLLIDPVLVSESDSETINMITSVAELAFRCLQFDSEVRPMMNEVLDELMDIQARKGIDTHESMRDLKPVNQSTQSETKDVVALLKDFPPSPVSVTREWQSESSASTTLSSSKGFGDRLALKNSIST